MQHLATITVGAIGLALFASGFSFAGAGVLMSDSDGPIMETGAEYEDHTCRGASTADEILGGNLNAVPATCDNGGFVRSGFSMGHGFSGLPYASEGWTGRIESWLIHDGNDRGFQCTFNGGSLVGCGGLGGSFPAIGAEFSHECLAFKALPAGQKIPIAETTWGCRVFGEITAV